MNKPFNWITESNVLKNMKNTNLQIEDKIRLNIIIAIVNISILVASIDLLIEILLYDIVGNVFLKLTFLLINILVKYMVSKGKNLNIAGLSLIFFETLAMILYWHESSLNNFAISISFLYVVIISIIIVENKIKYIVYFSHLVIFISMFLYDINHPQKHGSTMLEYLNVVLGTAIVGTMIFLIVGQYRRQLKLTRQKLYDFTIKDPLTDAYNVRFLNDELEKQNLMYTHSDQAFSLAIIDLDDFKAINDSYGHKVGDEILVSFANLIRDNIRPSDLFVRYGGDEFIIVLPKTCLDDAKLIMENVAEKLANNLQVSFSVGISDIIECNDKNEIIKFADKKLYKAKMLGKNQIVV